MHSNLCGGSKPQPTSHIKVGGADGARASLRWPDLDGRIKHFDGGQPEHKITIRTLRMMVGRFTLEDV